MKSLLKSLLTIITIKIACTVLPEYLINFFKKKGENKSLIFFLEILKYLFDLAEIIHWLLSNEKSEFVEIKIALVFADLFYRSKMQFK